MKAGVRRLQASLADLTPEQIALLLSVGLVLGVFPIMGFPTVFCLLAAFGLRLNLVALQLLNNIASPAQLALLLPLARAGTRLCGGVTPSGGSWTGTIGSAALHAITGWACICIPLGGVLYVGIVFFLRIAVRRGPAAGYLNPLVQVLCGRRLVPQASRPMRPAPDRHHNRIEPHGRTGASSCGL